MSFPDIINRHPVSSAFAISYAYFATALLAGR